MEASRTGLFWTWLAMVLAFILATGTKLPATVASHFVGSGEADAFMSRPVYLGAMCVFSTGVPALIVLVQQRMLRRRPERLNLPNKDYWLAPERREASLRAISAHIMLFGFGISLLIAFAHWEVIQANLRQPPRLAADRFMVAIAAFVLATGWWVYRLYARFRRVR